MEPNPNQIKMTGKKEVPTSTATKEYQTQLGLGGINVHGLYNLSTTQTPSIATAACRTAPPLPPKQPLKPNTYIGPSPLRQLLPIALFVLSFATVLSILIVYMDTTEFRHQQFRLNMSRDYELHGIPQDDPTLVTVIRELHLKRMPTNFLKNIAPDALATIERHDLVPEIAITIATLVGQNGPKKSGVFVQSLISSSGSMITAPFMAEELGWGGLIVEPDPKRYFSFRKENARRPHVQVVQACVSTNGFPKEVTLHSDESDVRINSLFDEETLWFNSRVKCFPLYTMMLAVNHTQIDALSLGCQGQELQILETIPFDKVNIDVISIHLDDYFNHMWNISPMSNASNVYVQLITRFLQSKAYKLVKKINHNYIYQSMIKHIKNIHNNQ